LLIPAIKDWITFPPKTERPFKKLTHTPLTKEDKGYTAGLSWIPREDRTHLRGRSKSSPSPLKERYRNKRKRYTLKIHDCYRYYACLKYHHYEQWLFENVRV
jgi:hypothetical protein